MNKDSTFFCFGRTLQGMSKNAYMVTFRGLWILPMLAPKRLALLSSSDRIVPQSDEDLIVKADWLNPKLSPRNPAPGRSPQKALVIAVNPKP